MLVTFSGMMGSGKTINAKKTLRWLHHAGYEPYYLRFRHLGWRSLLRTPAPERWRERESSPESEHPKPRRQKAARRLQVGKNLTLVLFFGYVLRAWRFRLFLFLHHRRHLVVVNRYFYDNLANYRLSTPREQKYLRWLLAAIPQPELAMLLVVRPETAHRRKQAYALSDLRQLAQNTQILQNCISPLTVIPTDVVATVDRRVEKHLRQVFQQRRKREHVQESHS
jgi:thymidylate kinase